MSEHLPATIRDVQGTADVVGITVAEFLPRDVVRLQQVRRGYPLIAR